MKQDNRDRALVSYWFGDRLLQDKADIIRTSQICFSKFLRIGGHPDLERREPLLTVAGQRQICTELSPLRPIADPDRNRYFS